MICLGFLMMLNVLLPRASWVSTISFSHAICWLRFQGPLHWLSRRDSCISLVRVSGVSEVW